MTSNELKGLIAFLIFIPVLMIVVGTMSSLSDSSDVEQMKICVSAGKQWVPVTDSSARYKCVN